MSKPTEPPKTSFITNAVKQLVPLLILVLGIKFFVADIFVIPSGSMETTLHGREFSGDRIFCTKVDYYWRKPSRWEVIVFKFPYEESKQYTTDNTAIYRGENFIKRCVGLPNEELIMIRGDVFTRRDSDKNAIRKVKTDDIQRNLWLGVYREDFATLRENDFAHYWSLHDISNLKTFAITPRVLQINTSAPVIFTYQAQTRLGNLSGIPDRYTRRQYVTYLCPQCKNETRQTVTTPQFTHHCATCKHYLTEKNINYYDFRTGYPSNDIGAVLAQANAGDETPRRDQWNFVTDLRILAQVQIAQIATTFSYMITNDVATAEFTLTAIENNQAQITLRFNNNTLAQKIIDFPLNTWREIEFYLCDGEYRAFVNGEQLFSLAPSGHDLPQNIPVRKSGVAFVVNGAVNIAELSLDRDIFYYDQRNGFFRITDGNYLAVGDNCPASNDSRNWGPVPEKNLVGPAWAVWWPLHAIRVIH